MPRPRGQQAPGGLPRLPAPGGRDGARQFPRPAPRRPGRTRDAGLRSARPEAGHRLERRWLMMSRSIRPSTPCMSATGQVDATSAARNSPSEPSLQPGTLVRYFGDYELRESAGRRRHGGRLQGPPDQPQPPGGPEDDQGRPVRLGGRGPPVPERGRGGRPARPSRHRADLRGRRARGPALLQHEADRG